MHWLRQLAELYGEQDTPLFHAAINTDLTVGISAGGRFIGAVVQHRRLEVPVTERSASRTSAVLPHPLCDALGYIAGGNALLSDDNRKWTVGHELYMQRLRAWAYSPYGTQRLKTLCHYLEGGTLMPDLVDSGVLAELKCDTVSKAVVSFSVAGVELCSDKQTQSSHIGYTRASAEDIGICCLTGELTALAGVHPKRITGPASSAKLITSAGLRIGSELSFKAHAVLGRLIAQGGVRIGEKLIVAWDDRGVPLTVGERHRNGMATVLVLHEISSGNLAVSCIGCTESAALLTIMGKISKSGAAQHDLEHLLCRAL